MLGIGRKRYGVTGARQRSLTVRLFTDKNGASAVEFAIVAPVFIAMMFSLYEIGWYYYQTSIMDAATADASRLIETGQVQKMSGNAAAKKQFIYDEVCNVLNKFGSCSERLTVEVNTYTTFAQLAAASATPATCADAPQADQDAIPFNPGSDLQIVRVRVCFLYSPVNPAIGLDFREAGSNYRRLVSTSVFCNEPYSSNGSNPSVPANPCGT